MERMTEKHYNEKDGYYLKCSGLPECGGTCDVCCEFDKVVDRLAAYEDTGLEPEEIAVLYDMDRRARMANMLRLEEYQQLGPIDRLRELAQADREGRIVVLEIPPKSWAWVCKKYCFTPHEAYFPTASAILTDMESGYVFGKTREEAEAALAAQKGVQHE